MVDKHELAEQFLQELARQGEKLRYARDSQKIVLQSDKEVRRLPLWRLDILIFQFLTAHAALAHTSVSEVLDEVLSKIL
jgi:hypothetical protein